MVVSKLYLGKLTSNTPNYTFKARVPSKEFFFLAKNLWLLHTSFAINEYNEKTNVK